MKAANDACFDSAELALADIGRRIEILGERAESLPESEQKELHGKVAEFELMKVNIGIALNNLSLGSAPAHAEARKATDRLIKELKDGLAETGARYGVVCWDTD